MSIEDERANQFKLPGQKSLSRSFESFFDKKLTFIREELDLLPSIDYSRPSRRTRRPSPLRLSVKKNDDSSAESSPENFVTPNREFPIVLADFSLLDIEETEDRKMSLNAGSSLLVPLPDVKRLSTALSLVDKFIGKSSDELAEFLKSYTSAAEFVPENDLPRFLKTVIGTKIKGKAAKVLEYKEVDTFDKLKDILTSLFVDKRSIGAVGAEFHACHQREGESVKLFACRVEELAGELSELSVKPGNSDEVNNALTESVQERALDVFTLGLNVKLRTIIRSRNYATLNAAIAAAIEEEQAMGLNTSRNYRKFGNHPKGREGSNVPRCDRCNKLGHLARNCYTRLSMPRENSPTQQTTVKREVQRVTMVCHYCKKPGHLIKECRARERANGRDYRPRYTNTNYRREDTRQNFNRTPGREPSNENQNSPTTSRGTADDRQTNAGSRVESYRANMVVTSQLENTIEIRAPELEKERANMLVDTGADITLIKIGKVKGDVQAEDEIVSLRGIAPMEIKTLCLVQLNIEIGNKTVTHPCRLVKDDFPLEADGILGQDFMAKHEVCIRANLGIEIYGIQFPYSGRNVVLKPRSETILLARTTDKGEGIVERQSIKPGVFIGNSLTVGQNGKCAISVMNTTADEVLINMPTVTLQTLTSYETDPTDANCDKERDTPTYVVHAVHGRNRMQTLRENLRTDHLNKEEETSLLELCEKYNEIFCLEGDKLGYTTMAEHSITLIPDTKPIYVKPYRLPQAHKEEVNRQVQEMVEEGIISPSVSQWNVPLLVVPKKPDASGKRKLRVVADLRQVNDATVGDSYPLPNITDILDQLGGAKYFSTLDLASGFHQIAMKKEDREKTAFSTPYGHFEYNRMPFGLKNAPATFQRLMNTVLSGLQGIKCFVYLDDIVVYGRSLKEHQDRLELVFERIRESGLKLQPNKCEFLRKETIYLGHVISESGIKPDPTKLDAVKNFPIPKRTKDIQSFLGLAGYYRRFIEHFSQIAKPLTQLLKKDQAYRWTAQEQEAFEILKEKLTTAPILQYPDFTKPFVLTTDASGKAIGAVLSQGKIGQDLPIAYASRILNKAEENYSTIEKELLAIVWATQHFRPYVYGTKFKIVTDHKPLTWLFNVKDPGSRLMRWKLKLAEYDYTIEYKAGKTNKNADALSRMFAITRGTKRKLNTETLAVASENADEENESQSEEEKSDITYTEDDKNQILREFHDTPLGGHLGIKRTLERIKLNHSWPGMRQDVEKYISKCEKCQKNKLTRITKAPMVITDTPTEPFEKCALDIVGPLPETSRRNKYILTFQDLLTKFSKAIPLEDQEANTVAKEFVTRIICEYGIPQRVLTDQGTNFLSQVFKNVCKLLKIEKIQTTAYHPQSNGALERSHRTLAEYLKNFITEDQTDWDEWLPYAMFTYNTTPHSSTGYTPYELVFGRQATLPTSLNQAPQLTYTYDKYAEELRERLRSTNNIARETLEINKDKSKRQYDKKTAEKSFKIGDQILLHDETVRRGRSKKLTPAWIGPYTIQGVHDNNNYTIIKGRRTLRVHANRLKHFIE